ncbi:hypothetical protein [Mycobacterium lepromatosis]|uniref:hypothetical protein n=1 Tax=Mycobacterium lepromatosis TaxID=480418 RepID=UPI0005F7E56B|nr:hypothetical protein [Mycobacterium lepromatosis]
MVNIDLDVNRPREFLAVNVMIEMIEPLTETDVELPEAMQFLAGRRGLSLGNRCCLALTVRNTFPRY